MAGGSNFEGGFVLGRICAYVEYFWGRFVVGGWDLEEICVGKGDLGEWEGICVRKGFFLLGGVFVLVRGFVGEDLCQ